MKNCPTRYMEWTFTSLSAIFFNNHPVTVHFLYFSNSGLEVMLSTILFTHAIYVSYRKQILLHSGIKHTYTYIFIYILIIAKTYICIHIYIHALTFLNQINFVRKKVLFLSYWWQYTVKILKLAALKQLLMLY